MELSSFVDIACTLHSITTIILVIEFSRSFNILFAISCCTKETLLKRQKLN